MVALRFGFGRRPSHGARFRSVVRGAPMTSWLKIVGLALLVCFLALRFIVGAARSDEAEALSCSWRRGGWVATCAEMAEALPPGHPVPPGLYQSAGVLVLYNAGCVEPGALFRFHSAYNPDTYELSQTGNEIMAQYLAQWPKLLAHLRSIRAFRGLDFQEMGAAQLARYGVPIC